MGRFWFFLGLLLLFGSCPLLIMAIMDPDQTPLGAAFGSIVCHSDEELVQYLGQVEHDGSRSVSFYCKNAAKVEREVTLQYVLLMIGAFVVPFLAGLTITITSSTRMARRRADKLIGTVWSQIDNASEEKIQFDSLAQPQSMSEVADLLGQVIQKKNIDLDGMDDTADKDNYLSEKLRELKETFDQGLINEDEYDALRAEILRKFKR